MKQNVREIFIGMLLGDGHIRRSGSNNAYIAFEQSAKKTEYLNFVKETLTKEGIELNSNQTYVREDARYGTTNSSVRFSTKVSEDLKPLADLFLDDEGKKRIHPDIGKELTVKGLAFWIQDDGQHVKKGGVTLCTDSYKPEEISILRKALELNFNMITSIHTKRNPNNPDLPYERIYINKKSLEKIKEELKIHMHPSMYYKLNIQEETVTTVNKTNTVSETQPVSVIDSSDDGGSDLGVD